MSLILKFAVILIRYNSIFKENFEIQPVGKYININKEDIIHIVIALKSQQLR